jgi:hypothetical protein
MMKETDYQGKLVKKLKELFPGCVIFKGNAAETQGVPDLTILYQHQWAMLEVKTSATAPQQPNQDYWVDHFDDMSFAAFIYPENEQEVLDELQRTFRSGR